MENNMWKDIKLVFRLMRYGMNLKSNIACSVIFVLLGFLMAFTSGSGAVWLGMYFVLPAALLVQVVYTLNLPDMVRACAMSKKMQLDFPVLANLLLTLAGYTLQVVLTAARGCLNSGTILFTGMLAFFYFVYYAFCFKYMVISMVLLFLAITVWIPLSFSQTEGFIWYMPWQDLFLPLPAAIALGYAMIFAGALTGRFCSKLIYRKDVSERYLDRMWGKNGK